MGPMACITGGGELVTAFESLAVKALGVLLCLVRMAPRAVDTSELVRMRQFLGIRVGVTR